MAKDLFLLDKAYKAGFKEQERTVVFQWSHGAHMEAVDSSPGPEKTTTSTGQYRESVTVSKDKPSGYVPGDKVAYSVPKPEAVNRALKRRRMGQKTVLSSSVPHAIYVEPLYHVMRKATNAGRKAMNGKEAGRFAKRAALNV